MICPLRIRALLDHLSLEYGFGPFQFGLLALGLALSMGVERCFGRGILHSMYGMIPISRDVHAAPNISPWLQVLPILIDRA